MTETTTKIIPLRTRLAMYGSGLFSDGATNVVIPLWALYLEPTPFVFGIVIGARSLLPFMLSIHGGVLMDRLGVRQVMLFFAAIGLIVPILFPLLPWIWMAALLNLILGLSSTMNWVGAQTLVGQVVRDDPSLTWQVSFCNRLGHLVCPLLAGVMWDLFGPKGGFGVTFVWAVLFMAAVSILPRGKDSSKSLVQKAPDPFRARDFLPRLEDYTKAFAMLSIPLMGVAIAGSVLNIAGGAIQTSFFIAYMKEMGLTGTLIGVVFACLNFSGLVGTASVSPLARRVGDVRLLNLTVLAALIAITITPLLGVFLSLLLVTVMRGLSVGISQPLMIMIPSKLVPSGSQGTVVGLRISLNRLMQTILPPVMGGVVSLVGLEHSFYWVGGTMVAIGCGLWIIFRPPSFLHG
ncbi:MAG: MFS transporter [Rhodospirillales bacterium]|jgi:MFS family permease|nr:MFS transporter [Rhodospirillales bacterium]MBT4005805.1 MFS transporter [Rhodospirillales bacterium]MBT5075160.1 MFS transporter [Rhodospirillales bacterium]MBT5114090.1 MFS transporter [Rhodospirillales bacterium]MBT5672618.1 MFS transporter [Rhodospirillales bacterium]